jgi:hypothetical protein
MKITIETFNLETLRSLTSNQLYTACLHTRCDIMKADHGLTQQMWIRSSADDARRRFAMIQQVGHEQFGWEKPFGRFSGVFA